MHPRGPQGPGVQRQEQQSPGRVHQKPPGAPGSVGDPRALPLQVRSRGEATDLEDHEEDEDGAGRERTQCARLPLAPTLRCLSTEGWEITKRRSS